MYSQFFDRYVLFVTGYDDLGILLNWLIEALEFVMAYVIKLSGVIYAS
jgi:hypothetical protein